MNFLKSLGEKSEEKTREGKNRKNNRQERRHQFLMIFLRLGI
jgi:hypothetical protein